MYYAVPYLFVCLSWESTVLNGKPVCEQYIKPSYLISMPWSSNWFSSSLIWAWATSSSFFRFPNLATQKSVRQFLVLIGEFWILWKKIAPNGCSTGQAIFTCCEELPVYTLSCLATCRACRRRPGTSWSLPPTHRPATPGWNSCAPSDCPRNYWNSENMLWLFDFLFCTTILAVLLLILALQVLIWCENKAKLSSM